MKRSLYLFTFMVIAAAVSCRNEDPVGTKPSLEVEKTTVVFGAGETAPVSVAVDAVDVDWKCEVPESAGWITASQSDARTLTIAVTVNSAAQERTGKVSVFAADSSLPAKEITVIQRGSDIPDTSEYTIKVAPASLTFEAQDAEAEYVTVTVEGGTFGWTVETEEGAGWIHAVPDEAGFTVTVDDNPATASRAANIVIVSAVEGVASKAVRVTQSGKVLPPSLSVDTEEITFKYLQDFGVTVNVEAVDINWNARTSDSPDGSGAELSWITVTVFKGDSNSSILVGARTNTTLQERSGYVVVTSDNPEVADIYIPVTQEAGREFLTDLTDDVEITDMAGAGSVLEFIPTQEWSDATTAVWYMALWGTGLDFVTVQWPWSQKYYGSGVRLYMTIRSQAIKFNDDNIYYLPDGEYTVAPDDPNNKVPFTIHAGEATQNIINPRGGWYYRLENDEYTQAAPLTGGSMNVERSGDEYTLTFDFTDDAGFRITGTCVAEMKVKVISSPAPKPER